MPHTKIEVRRKSIWRSQNNKTARKFAAMRAAKERKQIERLAAEVRRLSGYITALEDQLDSVGREIAQQQAKRDSEPSI